MRKNKVTVWGGIGEKKSNNNTQWYQQDRIYDPQGIAPALAEGKADLLVVVYENKKGDTR